MTSSNSIQFLNFSTNFLRILFGAVVLVFLGVFSLQSDYIPFMIIVEMVMGGLQWLHALYVGYKIGSVWHQRYFKFATSYLVVCVLLGGLASFTGAFGPLILMMIVLGLIVPVILAGFYALTQDSRLTLQRAPREADVELLDDTFYD